MTKKETSEKPVKKSTGKTNIKQNPIVSKPQKSKRLIHINEFLAQRNMRPEQKAGFLTYIGNSVYEPTLETWDKILEEYNNRTI